MNKKLKVKVFESNDSGYLERCFNKFTQENNIEIVETKEKTSVSAVSTREANYSGFINYDEIKLFSIYLYYTEKL